MNFFLDLIKKILESDRTDIQRGIFDFDVEGELQDSVLTVYTEEDGQITLAVFSKEQWDIVNDICALGGQDQESVVRSLAKDLPNVFTVHPDELA